jgi:MFS family permease
VRLLLVVQILWGLGFGLVGPLQPLYLGTLGADPGQIGLVFGVGNIVGGLLVSQILTLYTTPIVYLYLDRLQRRLTGKTEKRRKGALAPAE